MTAHLVTFSDESMSRARELCISSFKQHSGSLSVFYSSPELLRESSFYNDHRALLDRPRGCGYWAWKPYIINAVLANTHGEGFRQIPDGHYVVYADAGVEFINNVNYIIDRMDQDVFLFGNNWEHAHWCKRDVVEAIMPSRSDECPICHAWVFKNPGDHFPSCDVAHPPNQCCHYSQREFGKQAQASVIFFRVSDYSRAFVAEWLTWCLHRERYSTICTDEWRYLIDDSPSRLPNHPEFREHRHDQAILTTLAYREGIKLHYWPAMYNDGAFSYEKLPEYAADDYPILFHHHRRRDHEWEKVA